MRKVLKLTKKAVQTRKRVKFHREFIKRMQKEEQEIQNFLANGNNYNENSDDSSNNENEIYESLEEKLRAWVVKHKIKRIALSDLLKILKSTGLDYLPENSKTLMQTPRTVEIVSSCNGKLWYYGIEKSLRVIFSNIDRDVELLFNFNIDGLPLFHSSTIQFWPICLNIQSEFTRFD